MFMISFDLLCTALKTPARHLLILVVLAVNQMTLFRLVVSMQRHDKRDRKTGSTPGLFLLVEPLRYA